MPIVKPSKRLEKAQIQLAVIAPSEAAEKILRRVVRETRYGCHCTVGPDDGLLCPRHEAQRLIEEVDELREIIKQEHAKMSRKLSKK